MFQLVVGLYCSGWAKTGPHGGIQNTMESSYETADCILEDYETGTWGESNLYIAHTRFPHSGKLKRSCSSPQRSTIRKELLHSQTGTFRGIN